MIRLIQVGLGRWGANWATEVLPTVAAIEVVGYVDTDPAALAGVQAALGVPSARCFASLDAALDAVEAEAVLGSLPLSAHGTVGRAALAAGKHYLVEKPFAPSVAEAADLVELAHRHRRLLMVSQNYRFYPAALAAADLVAAGSLGRPLSIAVDFRRFLPSGGHPYAAIPHPMLGDMSVHHFDLLRFVLGREPVSVACRTWNPPGSPYLNDAAAVATIEFEGGLLVSYRANWVSRGAPTAWAGEWQMDFEGGEAAWTGRGDAGARLAAERLAIRPARGVPAVVALAPLVHHDRAGTSAAFAEAIRTGRTPPRFSSGADNLGTLALVEAAIRSAAAGGAPIRVADQFKTVAAADR